MANFSTSYDITQGGDLFAIQDKQASPGTSQYGAAKGTTVQSPLNYRKLVAFKNIDNEFYFFVKNQDRKPIKLHGMEVTASFVDRRTKSRIGVQSRAPVWYYQAPFWLIKTVSNQ